MTAPVAFWPNVDASGGVHACWPWQGNRNDNGYGRLFVNGRYEYVHRIALALSLSRPIADGMLACHTCDNPPCCNPLHLFEGTNADNLHDKAVKDRGNRGVLRPEAVELIREAIERPTVIAEALGVSVRTIYRARRPEYRARRAA